MMDNGLQDLGHWRSAISLTLLVMLLAWESFVPFFAFFAGQASERVRHGLKNVTLGVLNALVTGFVFSALWWTTAAWAQAHDFGLLHWVSLPGWTRWTGCGGVSSSPPSCIRCIIRAGR
jgi:hypothetical protein